jgi:hypothetical protein
VNVQELADLLNRMVADGRGGDDVLVTLLDDGGGVIDDRMQDILDRHDWEVRKLDRRSAGFVILATKPDAR